MADLHKKAQEKENRWERRQKQTMIWKVKNEWSEASFLVTFVFSIKDRHD